MQQKTKIIGNNEIIETTEKGIRTTITYYNPLIDLTNQIIEKIEQQERIAFFNKFNITKL